MKKYPFKFLDSYTLADKDMFFGRDDEIEELYQKAYQSKVVTVYGVSGSGKTSLVRCGLASKFKPYDWLSLLIRRGENLVDSFDATICEAGQMSISTKKSDERKSDEPIPDLAKKVEAAYLNSFLPIYLIFDQFEELYLLGDSKEQKQFVLTIKELLKIEQPIKVLFLIREEYLGYLYEFEKEVPQLLRKKIRVEPMNLDKVRQVIHGVAKYKHSLVHIEKGEEDAIAEALFNKIRGEDKTLTIDLPYFQVLLDKVYVNLTNDRFKKTETTFTLSAINKIGNIDDVLREYLETQVGIIKDELRSAHPDIDEDILWNILSPLVTLKGSKEPLKLEELHKRLTDIPPALIDDAVNAFIDHFILRFIEDDELYEIAHDALAEKIALKRSDEEIALIEIRQLIKNQTEQKDEARELFTEKQINFISPWLDKINISKEQEKLIEESREKINHDRKEALKSEVRTQNKKVIIICVFVALLIAAALLHSARLAEKKRSDANELLANANQLLARSISIYDKDHTQSYDLVSESLRLLETRQGRAWVEEIKNDLRNKSTTIYNPPLKGHNGYVKAVAFSPDGTKILSGSNDSTAILWNNKGEVVQRFIGQSDRVLDVGFSNTGDTIITASADGKIKLWNASDGSALSMKFNHDSKVTSAQFTPEGDQIISSGEDGKVKVWNLNGEEQLVMRGTVYGFQKVRNVAIDLLQQYMIWSSFNNKTFFWEMESDKGVQSYNLNEIEDGNILWSGISWRGEIANGHQSGKVILWSFPSSESNIPTFTKMYAHKQSILRVLFSPDGQYIISCSMDDTAKLWDRAGNEIKKFIGHTGDVTDADFYADENGHPIKVVTSSEDSTIRVWNLENMSLSTWY